MNEFSLNRRTFLSRSFGGLGTFALAQLLAEDAPSAAGGPDLLAPRKPHGTTKAKSVICLFQHGGPSQMALFDPKPRLEKEDGKPYPGKIIQHFHNRIGNVMAPPFRFAKYGDAGMDFSELVPHTASIADDPPTISLDEIDSGRTMGMEIYKPGSQRVAMEIQPAAPTPPGLRPGR